MKTDELISVLAAGAAPIAPGATRRRLAIACLIGALATSVLVFTILHPRDLVHAAATGPFWMKVGYAAWLGLGGYLLVDRVARPGASTGMATSVLSMALLTIVGLSLLDWIFLAPGQRMASWIGHSSLLCPFAILIAAVPVFIAVAVVLRGLAPTRLMLAGAAAGLLAGGVGATVYALWCREPSAMFVATWYTLGIAVCAGIGALLGPKILRW